MKSPKHWRKKAQKALAKSNHAKATKMFKKAEEAALKRRTQRITITRAYQEIDYLVPHRDNIVFLCKQSSQIQQGKPEP